MFQFSIVDMLYRLPAIIIALTFHEFAHGYTAFLMGDNTAKQRGRLTLNPVAHLDPIGFFMLMFSRFGWAKPVPINPFNFRERKKGMILVALAGPVMNFILATISMFLLYLFAKLRIQNEVINTMVMYSYIINIGLGVFNLIPIPPLDGSRILTGLLPPKQEFALYKYEQYSFLILILLVYTDVIGKILTPLINVMNTAITNLVGLFF